MSRNPMGGALIGKSRLLEIDAREFVSSHTDCCRTPANALSAHVQKNASFWAPLHESYPCPSGGSSRQWYPASKSTVLMSLFFPCIEAGHLEAEIMTRVELESAGGILLAERQQ